MLRYFCFAIWAHFDIWTHFDIYGSGIGWQVQCIGKLKKNSIEEKLTVDPEKDVFVFFFQIQPVKKANCVQVLTVKISIS